MEVNVAPISKDSLEWQCSLLKIGGLTVLLNCGWNVGLDPELLNPLLPHLSELDLIVLTHADIKHLGALPYLLGKHPITCPVICTEPVCRLGELSCVAYLEDRDKYQASPEEFSVDDVVRTFMSRITTLSYRETYNLQVRGRTLAACALPAGHHLGSACWTFHCGSYSVLYAVDFDLRCNRFLDGLELQRLLPTSRGAAQPWDLVITSPLPTLGGLLPQQGVQQAPQEASVPTKALTEARTIKEQLLLEGTIATLRRGGSVLIPSDVAGSVPEILLLLDAAWEQDRQLSSNYPLVWLSSMGDMVLDHLKTRLEWMSKEVLARFEERIASNPFMLRNVRIFQSLEELCSAHPLSRPKVIISSSPDLESGDARELFMRLCGEPMNLLWFLGLPPAGTLARQLVNDFVLQHATRKEYRLQQYMKQALPEEQLRAFYETKIQELSESGAKLPAELAMLKAEFEEMGRIKAEEGLAPEAATPFDDVAGAAAAVPGAGAAPASAVGAAPGVAAADPADASGAARAASLGLGLGRARQALRKGQAAAFWSPLGWSSSRTLAHSEVRNEGDEYGHLLNVVEMRTWKAQDQGSDKYGLAGEGGENLEGGNQQGKEAQGIALKQEMDDDPLGASGDWRESLRIHFPEPMKSEVRERIVRVGCRIRYLPENTMEPKDLYLLLRTIAPKHVVLLPTADEFTTGHLIAKQFRYAKLEKVPPPEVHLLDDKEPNLQLTLRAPKRRLQFSQELWPRLSFLRAQDGTRVARLRASLPPEAGVEQPRGAPLELGVCAAASATDAAASASGAEAATPSAELRLPRHGALFLAQCEEPLSLSSLQEHLRRAEWSRDDVQVEFRAPRPHSGRPWSARVLSTSGGALLGWAAPAPQTQGAESSAADAQPVASVAVAGRAASIGPQVLRLEGLPGEDFFTARRALYKRCTLV